MGATGYYTRVLSRYGHAILFAPVTFPRSVNLGIPRSWICTYYTP